MSPNERRERILGILQAAREPVPGEDLGARFGVGRTAVCQDIAVLRAEGHSISATPRGYVLDPPRTSGHREIVAVRHGPDRLEEELCALVDAGVTIADVVVEHPTYGELRGDLQIRGRDEVADFVARVRAGKVRLLSGLTDGVHMHTLWAADRSRLERARRKLRSLGLLLEDASGRRRVASGHAARAAAGGRTE